MLWSYALSQNAWLSDVFSVVQTEKVEMSHIWAGRRLEGRWQPCFYKVVCDDEVTTDMRIIIVQRPAVCDVQPHPLKPAFQYFWSLLHNICILQLFHVRQTLYEEVRGENTMRMISIFDLLILAFMEQWDKGVTHFNNCLLFSGSYSSTQVSSLVMTINKSFRSRLHMSRFSCHISTGRDFDC